MEMSDVKALFSWKVYKIQWAVLSALIALLVLFIVGSPSIFLSARIYTSALTTASYAGVMALGLAFIITLGEIDLSFPGTMTMCGLSFALVLGSTSSVLLSIATALVVGAVIGGTNGLFITKTGVPPIVVTIGTLFLWLGVSTVISDGRLIVMSSELSGHIMTQIFAGEVWIIPSQFIWISGLAIICWLILNRLTFGDSVSFIGDSEDASRMMGINVDRVKILTYTMLGIMAGFSAIFSNFEVLTWYPRVGMGYFLPTFAMVFMGGTSIKGGEGTIFGTVIGMIIIGLIRPGVIAGLGMSGYWTELFYGVIIIVSIIFQTLIRR